MLEFLTGKKQKKARKLSRTKLRKAKRGLELERVVHACRVKKLSRQIEEIDRLLRSGTEPEPEDGEDGNKHVGFRSKEERDLGLHVVLA